MLLVLRVHPDRARRCGLASAARCIPRAPRLLRADVLRWPDAPAWDRVPVVRLVQACCLVLPELRHPEPRLVLARASALLPAVLASVIRGRAASRKDQ